MNPHVAKKLAEVTASLLILIPCVLLLAWEAAIPNVLFYWFVLTLSSGTILAGLFLGEWRRGQVSIKQFVSKCGGFCIMFLFVLYHFVTLCF